MQAPLLNTTDVQAHQEFRAYVAALNNGTPHPSYDLVSAVLYVEGVAVEESVFNPLY